MWTPEGSMQSSSFQRLHVLSLFTSSFHKLGSCFFLDLLSKFCWNYSFSGSIKFSKVWTLMLRRMQCVDWTSRCQCCCRFSSRSGSSSWWNSEDSESEVPVQLFSTMKWEMMRFWHQLDLLPYQLPVMMNSQIIKSQILIKKTKLDQLSMKSPENMVGAPPA